MSKNVVVIASGETERRALPHLLDHLHECDVTVRIPPRNRALNVGTAFSLIQASLYDAGDSSPDKYVILVDTDGKDTDVVLKPFKEQLPNRLGSQFRPSVLFAYAQRHLEAWYFADSSSLRGYLGGSDLGSIDTSQPDNIENPKLHLKNLLRDNFYTARVSEEIAKTLNAETVSGRSPSFHGFLDAVKNGESSNPTD